MGDLDLVCCIFCVLLIWLLWQQLEKVKLEGERRTFTKNKQKKVTKSKKVSIKERIAIDEREFNYKKSASSVTSPLPLSDTISPSPPKSESLSLSQITSPAQTSIPIAPSKSSDQVQASSFSSTTAIPKGSTALPEQADQDRKNLRKKDETGFEWGPMDKQQIPQQKPWVFEGEAQYPPNFFTASHLSKE